jgi:hypothetical protein
VEMENKVKKNKIKRQKNDDDDNALVCGIKVMRCYVTIGRKHII